MTDCQLDENPYFTYLKNNLHEQLSKWVEPNWLVCVPERYADDINMIPIIAASQALCRCETNKLEYYSELCGSSILYEINDEDPRKIIWQEEKNNEVLIFQAIIINEYLVTVKDHVMHVLLIDHLLPSVIEDDHSYLSQNESLSLSSNKDAETFLRSFRCHYPMLEELEKELGKAKTDILPCGDVDHIQCYLHSLILQNWDLLIKRHIPQLQVDSAFQDLLFTSLDFFVVGLCHNELWNQVVERCQSVDQMVTARITCLKSYDITASQLGLATEFCTPLPAAVVEMATLNTRVSAIERLHCVRDSVELIEAQTKEARALVYQFKDNDTNPNCLQLSYEDLAGLMVVVIVQSQCLSLVANIYYMTHYIFSVADETQDLWQSLSLLRKCLELIMKLDISHLPPVHHPMRKELSLQDLMQVSVEVESKFEMPQCKEGSHSTSDITALHLQLHQLTQRIHQSTVAFSKTTLSGRNSPSRLSDGLATAAANLTPSQSKMQSFLEFLSGIPSTIRASFRRRQSEQRNAFHSSVQS